MASSHHRTPEHTALPVPIVCYAGLSPFAIDLSPFATAAVRCDAHRTRERGPLSAHALYDGHLWGSRDG